MNRSGRELYAAGEKIRALSIEIVQMTGPFSEPIIKRAQELHALGDTVVMASRSAKDAVVGDDALKDPDVIRILHDNPLAYSWFQLGVDYQARKEAADDATRGQ